MSLRYHQQDSRESSPKQTPIELLQDRRTFEEAIELHKKDQEKQPSKFVLPPSLEEDDDVAIQAENEAIVDIMYREHHTLPGTMREAKILVFSNKRPRLLDDIKPTNPLDEIAKVMDSLIQKVKDLEKTVAHLEAQPPTKKE